MAFVRLTHPQRRGARLLALGTSPIGEFTGLSLVLGIAVGFGSWALAGPDPDAVLVSLIAFALSAGIAGFGLSGSYPHDRLGLCNAITLARLALATTLLAPLVAGAGLSWAIFAIAAVALSFDGFDGWLARRHGRVSEFGARFDMEVDSVLAIILALNAAIFGPAGAVAILLGLPRYVFGAAAWVFPWICGALPPRFSRKVVCVVQLAVLIALQAPILPVGLAMALVITAAAALAWSFALDLRWLRRHRP